MHCPSRGPELLVHRGIASAKAALPPRPALVSVDGSRPAATGTAREVGGQGLHTATAISRLVCRYEQSSIQPSQREQGVEKAPRGLGSLACKP